MEVLTAFATASDTGRYHTVESAYERPSPVPLQMFDFS